MRSHSRLPPGQGDHQDDILSDLERFEAELDASIARLDRRRDGETSEVVVSVDVDGDAADNTDAADNAAAAPAVQAPESAAQPAPTTIPSRPAAPPQNLPAAVPAYAPQAAATTSATSAAPPAPPAAPPVIRLITPPPPAPATPPTPEIDLLSELRQAAQEKTAAAAVNESERKARIERTEKVMRGLFRYLGEFCGHLDKIEPLVPHVFRPLPNVELSALHWTESFIDYRTNGGTETSTLDTVSLRYTLSAGNTCRIDKLPHHAPAFLDELKRLGLRYVANEKRGNRGLVEQVCFTIDRALVVSLQFKADPDQETVALRTRNFNGLGDATYRIRVAELDRALLDQLGRHILGRPNQFLQRIDKE